MRYSALQCATVRYSALQCGGGVVNSASLFDREWTNSPRWLTSTAPRCGCIRPFQTLSPPLSTNSLSLVKVSEVTLHDLLHMASGIPDFDTANPSRSGPDLDTFRATVYKNPTHNYLEPALLSEPWVATKNLTSVPGQGFHYSSTNFGLLGLILAGQHGVVDYRNLNQSAFLPASLAAVADEIGWAGLGSPREHGVVEGFDRTDYNGQDPTKHPGDLRHFNADSRHFNAHSRHFNAQEESPYGTSTEFLQAGRPLISSGVRRASLRWDTHSGGSPPRSSLWRRGI